MGLLSFTRNLCCVWTQPTNQTHPFHFVSQSLPAIPVTLFYPVFSICLCCFSIWLNLKDVSWRVVAFCWFNPKTLGSWVIFIHVSVVVKVLPSCSLPRCLSGVFWLLLLYFLDLAGLLQGQLAEPLSQRHASGTGCVSNGQRHHAVSHELRQLHTAKLSLQLTG